MKQSIVGTLLLILSMLLAEATELKRNGWNLISICEDMNRSQIDMTNIEEVQSQSGESIYTGDWEEYSNLNFLNSGYGYWVKAEANVSFDSGKSKGLLVKSLTRTGWNLMASCEDIPQTNLNMSELEEIQNQEGKSIYTG
jgi:hypothetical protein